MRVDTKYFKLVITTYCGKFWFWFRLFDYGIKVANTPMIYSERTGAMKCYSFLGLKITLLDKFEIGER